MWTSDQRAEFERDGILRLPQAFGRDNAAAMVEAIWRFVERKSDIRRDEPGTWCRPPISFKSLKHNPVFNPLVDNDAVRDALDGMFGAEGWHPPKPGAQVLLTFPTPSPWTPPQHLWHMDSDFVRPTWPTFAVKMFACISALRPEGGATLALAGSHRLVEGFGATLAADARGGNQSTWRRFMKQHPWLEEIIRPGDEPERTRRLLGTERDVNGVPMRIVEMCGEPGDVFITHLHVFHCAAPNTNDTPRLMLGKGIFERARSHHRAIANADL